MLDRLGRTVNEVVDSPGDDEALNLRPAEVTRCTRYLVVARDDEQRHQYSSSHRAWRCPALDRLAGLDPAKAELVKLLYFAGMTLPQAAEALGLSHAAAKRLWAYSRAFELAESLHRQRLAAQKRVEGEQHPAVAGTLASLGLNLISQEKWTDAESSFRECLAIREQAQPDLWSTFNARSLLGGSLLGQKKYAEAEPLLLSGFEGMKAREAKVPLKSKNRLPEAVGRIIQLYEAVGKADEAARWRAKLKFSTKTRPDKTAGGAVAERPVRSLIARPSSQCQNVTHSPRLVRSR